jgi:hypothetical protein
MSQVRYWLPLFLTLASPAGLLQAADVFRYSNARHGKGELTHINGLPVLILQGTPEEMGEQAAVLTDRALRQLLPFPRELLRHQGLEFTWSVVLALSKSLESRIPLCYLREIDALVKKSGVERDLAILGNTFPDISKVGACSSLIVGTRRSAVGGPLLGRNFDYYTLGRLHHYSLVTVYQPRGKKAFASIGFPGLIGCLSGINEDGLALAVHEVLSAGDRSVKLDLAGSPYALCFRRVLEECATVKAAEELLRSVKRTTMLNLAVCDRGSGAVFEITPKNLVVRQGEDGICSCTNHFCSKELRTGVKCWRLPLLEESRRLEKLALAEVARKLDAVNLGGATLQTMIFEPKTLTLHLAIGACPSSALPLKELRLGPLFKKGISPDRGTSVK